MSPLSMRPTNNDFFSFYFSTSYRENDRVSRHQLLEFKCKKNYPTGPNLKEAGLLCASIQAYGLSHVLDGNPRIALATYPSIIEFLQEHDRHNPCAEIAEFQHAYGVTMAVLYNVHCLVFAYGQKYTTNIS